MTRIACFSLALALASGCARDGFEGTDAPDAEDSTGASPVDAGADNTEKPLPNITDASTPAQGGGETNDADTGGGETPSPDGDADIAGADSCDAPALPEEVSLPGGAVISAVRIEGAGNRASVTAGQSFTLSLTFRSEISSCLTVMSPFRVLNVGFADGPSECTDPELCTARSTPFEVSLKAPSAPGNYDLHAEFQGIVSPTVTCGGLQQASDATTRIATICIH
jgi:hypothetical protein